MAQSSRRPSQWELTRPAYALVVHGPAPSVKAADFDGWFWAGVAFLLLAAGDIIGTAVAFSQHAPSTATFAAFAGAFTFAAAKCLLQVRDGKVRRRQQHPAAAADARWLSWKSRPHAHDFPATTDTMYATHIEQDGSNIRLEQLVYVPAPGLTERESMRCYLLRETTFPGATPVAELAETKLLWQEQARKLEERRALEIEFTNEQQRLQLITSRQRQRAQQDRETDVASTVAALQP